VLDGTLSSVYHARTFIDCAFELSPLPRAPNATLATSSSAWAKALVETLTAPATCELLDNLTEGPWRFRLDVPDTLGTVGERRRFAQAVDEGLRAAGSRLVNDAREAPWEIGLRLRTRDIALELRPRAALDPRFAYRVADVPAASHPSIAAMLVHVADITSRDTVWDPFCGSAVELVEAGLRARGVKLFGSDTSRAALAAAKKNAESAAVPVRLSQCDATELPSFLPRDGASAVVTNPPMGKRVGRDSNLEALLEAAFGSMADALRPGGRLVWMSPRGALTRKWARQAGLSLTHAATVDLGGLEVELQRFDKPNR
jgi:23S rRNA G2445 N2-methylase RlmL